jgi:hypothetical protein
MLERKKAKGMRAGPLCNGFDVVRRLKYTQVFIGRGV